MTPDMKKARPVPIFNCSICNELIEVEWPSGWSQGHNARPVNDGRCCSDCNWTVVIPARLALIFRPPRHGGSERS